ncbi:MAG TPA: cbb3-type cytochrome c oxidase subunit II [Chloroflexia bacterium]|nr:cbb3-type cytochrome c oxidase subunit II [Chloroflexia bacterium]
MTGKPIFRMDVPTVAFGAMIVFWSIIFVVVALPYLTFRPPQSADARPLTVQEERGRKLYAANGCYYCHSQYLRAQDWTGVGSFRTIGRVAQAGDYYYQQTPLLGTERTGPDLSQEGGVHTDEWHLAHFRNPRYTFPKSIMPEFSFYYNAGDEPGPEIYDLVAYVQSLGGRAADDRTARQRTLKQKLLTERAKGNQAIIHEWFPTTWRNVRNPMEPTQRSLLHGKTVFLTNCIGCHGLNGDGKGPASRWVGGVDGQPAPRNFTDITSHQLFSDGELYDAILFGVDGTAMPAWGDMLTVNDIWDVTNFLRTIPNGGLQREPTADMMVSAPDYKPIELTPLTTMLTPPPASPTPSGGELATPPAATATP